MERSLEETPSWALSIVCLALTLLSVLIEGAIRLLTKALKRRKRKSLSHAFGKIKTELMILGLLSLLLTVAESPISKICVTKAVGNSFLPCQDPFHTDDDEPAFSSATEILGSNGTLTTGHQSEITGGDENCKAKGMVSLISKEGIKQLHIFIFVLAVFHVLYCVLTMFLGMAKMSKWKAWEEETKTLEYQIANDPRRFRLTRDTSFGRRHLKFWSDNPLMLWLVCVLRQFSGSVTKADYFTLRNGFIVAHNIAEGSDFDFRKFLNTAFDHDFEKVVGISFWIWIFSIFFIFFSAHEFYNYFWLPFVPLMMVLVIGTKLQVIITKMYLESPNKSTVVQGTFLVKPNDDLFWFGRPQWLLYLIHFILFQNSFQLAFFTWTWYEFGLRSCFHRKTEDITIRIAMGVIVQLLCGYVTLPLYALVTQMGSSMKAAVFTESVSKGLRHWQNQARRSLSRNISISSEPYPTNVTESSFSDVQEPSPPYEHLPSPSVTSPRPEFSEDQVQHKNLLSPGVENSSTIEIIEETVENKTIAREPFDGEISFGTSWKGLESEKPITSVPDDTSSDVTVT
ncbi:PREDICTED: MLO-like protein 12 isoform X2 [Nelumbo nucifera]|uniref:MLO-like protein n=1 Tax=Nelumbo nucifera TaxID=4432 RepID=A0A1U8A617_NELNU|nr:PREDICTED: MLO-like protein 12 isoform X2 [Nelumbo nucifera]